jgi:flagellar biosynthesis chaperone FliJ
MRWLVIGLVALGSMGIGASPAAAGTSETLSAASTKTKLVLKLRGDERVSMKSRFESTPPTIVLDFPSGRVAGSLPEKSVVGQGIIREIRTAYYASTGAGDPRWVKALSVELAGRYSYAVRQEADAIVIEIEHPRDQADQALQVGLASGTVIVGQAPPAAQERFRAMQDALSRVTAKPAAAAPSAEAKQRVAETGTRPSAAPVRRASRQARAKLKAPRQAIPASVWWLLAVGVAGAAASVLWAISRQSGPFFSRRRQDGSSLASDVIDQLVWRAFEQQGQQLAQIVQGGPTTGPLRIMEKDGHKAALQCVSGGAFFERASVERFANAMQDASVEQGYLVAAGSFTVPAQRFAKERGVTLIGRDSLTELLSAGASQEQYVKQVQEINGNLQRSRETLDEYARQLDMIRRQRNEACWLLGEERAKLAKIEADHADLSQNASQWRTDAEHWEETAKLNHKKWEESQWYLGESRTYAEHIEAQLQPLQESYAQLEQRVQELMGAVTDAQRQREESQWYLGEAKVANQTLQEGIRALEQRVEQFQERMQSLERQLEDNQKVLASERMERERLQERLATFQAVGERRRTSRRYVKDTMVALHATDGTPILQVAPRDVSGGGVGISCEKGMALPEQASLRVEFLNGDQVLETEGRLVWTRESPDSAEQWSGYEFADLPEEIRRAIEQLLTLPN